MACEDYLQALDFEPQNQSCLQELARCLCNIEREIVQKIEELESGNDNNNNQTKKGGDLHQLKKQLMLVRKDITNVGSRLKDNTVKEKPPQEKPSTLSLDQRVAKASKELAKDKCNSVAYLERALAYQLLGNLESAEKDYRDGLRFVYYILLFSWYIFLKSFLIFQS